MIIHQAINEIGDACFFAMLPQQAYIEFSVLVFEKNPLTAVSSHDDVMGTADDNHSSESRHGEIVPG